VKVSADGDGAVSPAGAALPREAAQRTGLVPGVTAALAGTYQDVPERLDRPRPVVQGLANGVVHQRQANQGNGGARLRRLGVGRRVRLSSQIRDTSSIQQIGRSASVGGGKRAC
jgi:hypothetical protein